jgi:hypothetical protein
MPRMTVALLMLGLLGCSQAAPTNQAASSSQSTFWKYTRTPDLMRDVVNTTATTEGYFHGDEKDLAGQPSVLEMTIRRVAGEPDAGSLDMICTRGFEPLIRIDRSPPMKVECYYPSKDVAIGLTVFGADVVEEIERSTQTFVELSYGQQYIFYTEGLDLDGHNN